MKLINTFVVEQPGQIISGVADAIVMLPFPAVPPDVFIEAVGRQNVQPGCEVIVVAVLGDPAIIVTLPFCPGVSPPVAILKTVLPPNPGSVMVPPEAPFASATKVISPPLPK